MTYLSSLCDLAFSGVYHTVRALVSPVPSVCWLCDTRTRAGHLCLYCHGRVVASMRSAMPRCQVCALSGYEHPECPDCRVLTPAFDRVIAAFDYDFPGRMLVQQFKQQHRFVLSRPLAHLMIQALDYTGQSPDTGTVVIPVPSSRAALRQRGFNPAALLARDFACHYGLRYRPSWVRRSDHTVVRSPQKMRSRRDRLLETEDLFHCAGLPAIPVHTVWLVDDVMTTGSTLHAMARLLKNEGVASVTGLVLARTPHRVAIRTTVAGA